MKEPTVAAKTAPTDDATDEAPAARKIASGDVVVYIGTADERDIDAAAWRGVGVEDQHKIVWNKANKFAVPAAEFTDDALAYFATDPGFAIRPANV